MRLSDVFGDSIFFRYWVAGLARVRLFNPYKRFVKANVLKMIYS